MRTPKGRRALDYSHWAERRVSVRPELPWLSGPLRLVLPSQPCGVHLLFLGPHRPGRGKCIFVCADGSFNYPTQLAEWAEAWLVIHDYSPFLDPADVQIHRPLGWTQPPSQLPANTLVKNSTVNKKSKSSNVTRQSTQNVTKMHTRWSYAKHRWHMFCWRFKSVNQRFYK